MRFDNGTGATCPHRGYNTVSRGSPHRGTVLWRDMWNRGQRSHFATRPFSESGNLELFCSGIGCGTERKQCCLLLKHLFFNTLIKLLFSCKVNYKLTTSTQKLSS